MNIIFKNISKYLFLYILIIGFSYKAESGHIVGGEIELVHVNEFTYDLNLIVYFDRYQNGQNPPPNPGPEAAATVYIYGNNNDEVLDIFILNLSTDENVSYTNQECAIEELVTSRPFYTLEVTLDSERYSDPAGYYIVWERCCRNASMVNVANDGFTVGMTYVLEFPAITKDGIPFLNSSPKLSPALSDYACVNQLYYTSFAATDTDGDSLVYSLVAPLNSSQSIPVPTPQPKPHFSVEFVLGFSELNMIPGTPSLRISTDGLLTVKPSFIGVYVFSVLVEEYRFGEKIGQVTRDFQMLVVDGCDAPNPPDAEVRLPGVSQFYNELDTIRFTVSDEKCFEFLVIDDAGEEVRLRAEGVNFTSSVDQIFEFEQGFINAAKDTLRVQVCVPGCPYVRDIPYIIDLIASDNTCPLPQLDTVRLIIEVQPPHNEPPFFVNDEKNKSISVLENNLFSEKFYAIDSNENFMIARLEGIGFAPESFGMTIEGLNTRSGFLDFEFQWDTDCQKYDFNVQNDFELFLIVDDLDFCSEFEGDTIFYNLNVVLTPNTIPTGIILSNNMIDENEEVGVNIGVFSSNDPDEKDAHTYTLIENNGDEMDNDYFQIVGTELRSALDFDFELKNSYTINVESNDGSGGAITKVFDIAILDLNDQVLALEKSIEIELNVYPNPVTSTIYFDIKNPNEFELIDLKDISGKNIRYNVSNLNNGKLEVDISENTSGIYIVNMNYKGFFYAIRIKKQ